MIIEMIKFTDKVVEMQTLCLTGSLSQLRKKSIKRNTGKKDILSSMEAMHVIL